MTTVVEVRLDKVKTKENEPPSSKMEITSVRTVDFHHLSVEDYVKGVFHEKDGDVLYCSHTDRYTVRSGSKIIHVFPKEAFGNMSVKGMVTDVYNAS